MRQLILCAAAAALSSCTFNEVDNAYPPGLRPQRAALRAIADCVDLEQTLKDQMAARMNAELDANLTYALDWVENQDAYCWCWYGQGDGANIDCSELGYYNDCYDCDYAGGMDPTGSAPPAPNERADDGANDYSTTNTQVVGVDEADFVKNDGSHIYVVSGDQFLVLDAWPAPETHVLASLPIEGVPNRLYVEADHAVIYSDVGDGQQCSWDGYGYVTLGGQLKITVFDISDRAAPVLDREIFLSGSYVNSRRIGSAVHTVVTFPQATDINLPTWPNGLSLYGCWNEQNLTVDSVTAIFETLRADNLAAIAAVDMGDFLPSATDIDYLADGSSTTSEGLFVDCQNFYEPRSPGAPGYLSVVSFNLEEDDTLGSATILGRAGEVYASAGNLYVAVQEWQNVDDYGYYGGNEITLLHKFGIDAIGAAPLYHASGLVPGRLVNQFAMDEHQGSFRVATTEGYLPSPDCSNNVFVLGETPPCGMPDGFGNYVGCDCVEPDQDCHLGPVLDIIGAIRGIAPTEDIRSVRFDGDRGFMVTFKKTDPLFAFDLSDPTHPVTTGELKIPGFSTYMHFMDEDHLLTIGFDAEDHGSFAYFQGIILQIFDVSNPSYPALTFKETIGTRGTTSDATNDHMAFNYFPSRDLLAIPMGICEDSGGGGSYGTNMTFNGLLVYQVTATGGFTLLGGVDHRDPSVDYDDYNCSNWWTNANSQVKRSIFMDDFVFSISPEQLKVNELTALDADLTSIDMPQLAAEQTYDGCYGW